MKLKKTHIKKIISLTNQMTLSAFNDTYLYLDVDGTTLTLVSKYAVYFQGEIENADDVRNGIEDAIFDFQFEKIEGEMIDKIDLYITKTKGFEYTTNEFNRFANVVQDNWKSYAYIALVYNKDNEGLDLLPCNNLTYTLAFMRKENLEATIFDSKKLHYLFRTLEAMNEKKVLFNIPNSDEEPSRFMGEHSIACLMPMALTKEAS